MANCEHITDLSLSCVAECRCLKSLLLFLLFVPLPPPITRPPRPSPPLRPPPPPPPPHPPPFLTLLKVPSIHQHSCQSSQRLAPRLRPLNKHEPNISFISKSSFLITPSFQVLLGSGVLPLLADMNVSSCPAVTDTGCIALFQVCSTRNRFPVFI